MVLSVQQEAPASPSEAVLDSEGHMWTKMCDSQVPAPSFRILCEEGDGETREREVWASLLRLLLFLFWVF